MTTSEPNSDSDASTVDPRTRRARNEAMEVSLRQTGGIYTVHSESENTYRVDITRNECTCPDQQKPEIERCKHLRRVDMEIRHRTVPTPDGRLPERPVADGGVTASSTRSDESETATRIDGPLLEFDKHGEPTGMTYFRCTACGQEAMREGDLADCCPVVEQ
jgi:hypothetical protein